MADESSKNEQDYDKLLQEILASDIMSEIIDDAHEYSEIDRSSFAGIEEDEYENIIESWTHSVAGLAYDLSDLPEKIRHVCATKGFEDEINCDGIIIPALYGKKEDIEYTLIGYKAIGSVYYTELLTKIFDLYSKSDESGYLLETEKDRLLEGAFDEIGEFSNTISENTFLLRLEYIKKNLDEIIKETKS